MKQREQQSFLLAHKIDLAQITLLILSKDDKQVFGLLEITSRTPHLCLNRVVTHRLR